MTKRNARKPGSTKTDPPPAPPPSSPQPASRGGLIQPLAEDDVLVEAFKRYVALKEKLLEDYDYTWYAVYRVGKKVEKVARDSREEAEEMLRGLAKQKVKGTLEKKIKKSGCRKLDKAFGISHTILDYERADGFVRYVIMAIAPNGQSGPQSGSCSKDEKGKAGAALHRLDATALTRAKNRATMDLLGGETTAEEFEDYLDDGKGAAPTQTTTGGAPDNQPPPTKPPPKPQTPEEIRADIDKKFAGTSAAKPVSIQQLRGRLFAALKATGLDPKFAEAKLKATLKDRYKVDSTKDLTEAQILEITAKLETMKEK